MPFGWKKVFARWDSGIGLPPFPRGWIPVYIGNLTRTGWRFPGVRPKRLPWPGHFIKTPPLLFWTNPQTGLLPVLRYDPGVPGGGDCGAGNPPGAIGESPGGIPRPLECPGAILYRIKRNTRQSLDKATAGCYSFGVGRWNYAAKTENDPV